MAAASGFCFWLRLCCPVGKTPSSAPDPQVRLCNSRTPSHTPRPLADKPGVKKLLLLCAALTGAVQAQTVTVTPTPASLTFTYQVGATTLPASQTISLKASSGTPTFTTSITGSALWLTASPDSGKLPATITVRVNPTTLPAATYNNVSVTITVSGVANPVSIPVTLVVTPAPSTLTLSATTLNFTAPPLPPTSQTVFLSTNGAPISFTVTSGATWLTVATRLGGASDIVFQGEQYPLVVAVDPTGLAPQAAPYVGKITLATSGAATTAKSQTITVNFTVSSLTPTISTVWPSTLPVNGPAQTITIVGTNFYSGTIAKIKGVATALTTTTYKDSSTVLQAVVPASLLTSATTWSVYVSNPAPGGDSLSALNLNVANTPTIGGIVNAASFATGPVAAADLGTVSPGELVTIFGTNIGPVNPVSMTVTGGVVDTVQGGVSVKVDGVAAPLIYVSQNQITIQIPYEATVGSGKVVKVTNGANPAATATVTIGATAPGIFTADGSGAGPAAALNYNATTKQYVLNSASNLAKIGDLVILYLTGEGIYDQAPLMGGASDTGFVVPLNPASLPQVSPAPTVKIGGQTADVTDARFYAGPVPGSIFGLLQINAVVPTGATTGTAVPVIITIGGAQTQSNVTLAIHP